MAMLDLFLYEEDHTELQELIRKLFRDAEAKAVFLIDKNGQQLLAAGDYANIDTTSLATLTAGNVAATDSLAKLLGEKGFTILFHEGESDNIHISVVGEYAILVVIFDDRTSVGLVRLRVKRMTNAIETIMNRAVNREEKRIKERQISGQRSRLAEITDEDIENLFK